MLQDDVCMLPINLKVLHLRRIHAPATRVDGPVHHSPTKPSLRFVASTTHSRMPTY